MLQNKKQLSLGEIEKKLKKQLPDYEYQQINNVVLVSKTSAVKLNVIVEAETVQVVEAVDFIPKLAAAICMIGAVFYFFQPLDLAIWLQSIGYILAFLVGGLLGDGYHRLRYKKEYQDFKPKVETALRDFL